MEKSCPLHWEPRFFKSFPFFLRTLPTSFPKRNCKVFSLMPLKSFAQKIPPALYTTPLLPAINKYIHNYSQLTRIRSWWRWANTLLPSAKNIPRTPPARSTTAFAKKLPKPSVRMSTALSIGILSRTCVRAFKTKMLLG